MLLLTAPSKTQQPYSHHFPLATRPLLLEQTEELIACLKQFDLDQICTVMKVSRKLGELTWQRIAAFRTPLTQPDCSPALFTFKGDAYETLSPETYSEKELLHAQHHLGILSGLYGLLRPFDLMHPYRLEMGTKLATDRGGNLYRFWGQRITETVNTLCTEHSISTVINLASAEYFKAIQPRHLSPGLLTITFKEQRGDVFRTIPIHSKRARGKMIDYVITNRLNSADHLQDFSESGYTFRKELSTPTEWVFARPME